MLWLDEDSSVGLLIKIILTVVFLGVSWVGYEFYPDILRLKREAVVNSHQYIEASRSKLSKLASEYRSAEKEIAAYKVADGDYEKVIEGIDAQKGALKEQMGVEADKIPEEEIPLQVIKILEEE